MKEIDINNYELILLDWDGTLVHSRENVIYAMQIVSHKYRNIDWFELDLERNKSQALEDNFETFFGSRKNEAYELYLNSYLLEIAKNVKKINAADKLFLFLDKLGKKKAIVTSKDRRLWEAENNMFSTYFDFSICKDESIHNKPFPNPILDAIAYFAIPKSKVLMIGDSEHDYLSSQSAGIDSVIIGRKIDNALFFANLEELLQSIS